MAGKILVTENNYQYLIINIININNTQYGFLTNINNQQDSFFAEMTDTGIVKVESPEIKEQIMNYLLNV